MVEVELKIFLKLFFQKCFVERKKMCSFALPLREMRGQKQEEVH